MSALDELRALLRESLEGGTFVSLVLSSPAAAAEAGLLRSTARRVELKKGPHLSFTHRFATRDVTENVPLLRAPDFVVRALETRFRVANLFTTTCDAELRAGPGGALRLKKRAPTKREAPPTSHDHQKKRALRAGSAAYLEPLGIVDGRGKVRAGMEHKYRQIHRYVELLEPLMRRAGLAQGGAERVVRIVDAGAGKGYLTFALYDHLSGVMGVRAELLALEARPELCALGNELAKRVGFGGLTFRAGTLLDAELGPLDALIALHACDTATDDAIYRGVLAGASLIVCAPCCHKELRPQLRVKEEGLAAVLRHGILEEREAELVTDGARALLLEASGYKTEVFEFIAAEHTAKNVMIAAVRGGEGGDAALARYRSLKEAFGFRAQRLEALLFPKGLPQR